MLKVSDESIYLVNTILHRNTLIHHIIKCENEVIVLTFIVCTLSPLLRRSQVESPQSSIESSSQSKTHMWVSARHGDLSEWGPYSGLSMLLFSLFQPSGDFKKLLISKGDCLNLSLLKNIYCDMIFC